MSWQRAEPDATDRNRVLARIVFTVGVALLISGVSTSATADRVHRSLLGSFGSAERDLAIEAAPELLEGTLMSKDALEGDPSRSIISYEYFYDGVMYVGYAAVDIDETIRWKRLGPIDIEVAPHRPELSRPEGLVLAPAGWISDAWEEAAQPFALFQAFASALLIALSVWVRNR